ncbi:LysR family transcriptional regulator [Haloactinomyces albus]|uniref:DNA-binding transcriptional LysR family regulator n=1 Tax=Haloactinomyces albus TaxID=1352928 RepID=A0AAE3ZB56_9ACTN|nr:LysR family transcriptional regulator [Haloactinomyces albus]MDR7300421.1 DNA-binding transcriptional LysR family regulator [Haloactinomyces albus]
MEIRWVEAFIAVAEELHFGRAAERLHMGQSPLSQTVKKLERRLGATLFERSTRAVSLTSAGHAFLPHARRIVGEMDLAQRAARATHGEVYGQVTIGFSGALNHRTLPPLTRTVRTRHPNIALTLVNRVATYDALHQLQQGSLDLAFVGLPLSAEMVCSRDIAEESLGVVLPVDHPLATADGIDLAELSGDDFVTMPLQAGSVYREIVVNACVRAGFRPRIAQEVYDPYLILSFVAAGVGVSLAPECLRSIMPAGAVFVPLVGTPPVLRTGIAWNPEHSSEALRAILAVADEVFAPADVSAEDSADVPGNA